MNAPRSDTDASLFEHSRDDDACAADGRSVLQLSAELRTTGRRRGITELAFMVGGTTLVGIAGYAFVAIAGHTLPPAESAAVVSFYLLANIVGPGLFAGVEQETNRLTSRAVAMNHPVAPVLRRTATHGAGLLCMVLAVLAALSPLLIVRSFTGHGVLLVAGLATASAAAGLYLVRGLLGGLQQVGGYAASLAAEGLARLLPTLALALVGGAPAGAFGFAFLLGTGTGALAGVFWLRRSCGGHVIFRGMARRTSMIGPSAATHTVELLAGATFLMFLIANVAPIVVTSRLTEDTAIASSFASAFVLARVPLLLFAPVQVMLPSRMTAAVTRREYSPLRTKVRTALVTVAVLGGVGTVCLAVIGPWAVRVFFGGKAYISGPVLALLGVGTILLMVTQVMQAVLIALGAHRLVVGAWLLGAVVFAGLILWPGNPLWTAVSAQLVGPAVIVLGMGSALIVLLSRRGTRPMSPSERWDGGSVPEKEMIEPGSAKNAATDRAEYTNRLVRLEGARWKQVLNVQAPYRWNMRRINLGYTLDVGCGLGRNLEHLDKNGVGVDHNRTSVEFARSRGLTVFTVEEFVSSDYAKPNSFDSILAAHLVEHLAEEESREVLASYLPFLRADGFVVFITPQERGYASDETHVQFMGFDEVTRLATELGLTVERTYSFPLPRIFGRVFTYNEFVVIARKP